ncbi:hypothetical protein [Salegentibacter sp. F14]
MARINMREDFSKEGIENQKKLIGEFVILFEDINDWIRLLIPEIVLQNSANYQQKKNVETLLTDLTAEPLKSKFDSLIFDNFSEFPELINTNKKLSKKVSNLNIIRNSIVHGSYRLGWKNFEGELSDQTFSIRHSKTTGKGYQKRSKIFRTSDLINLNKNLRKISGCYNSLAVIILHSNIFKQKNNAEEQIKNFQECVEEIENIKLEHLDILN